MRHNIYIGGVPRRGMNIFVLDTTIDESVKQYSDAHVIKMPLETTQIISTNLRIQIPITFPNIEWTEEALKPMLPWTKAGNPYKSTHPNHPCTIWGRETKENFDYTVRLGIALCREYKHRFGKVHACYEELIRIQKGGFGKFFPSYALTPFAQAMPDECKHPDAITAYRNYYIHKVNNTTHTPSKTWTKRHRPRWLAKPTPPTVDPETVKPKREDYDSHSEYWSAVSASAWARQRDIQMEIWLEWAWENLHIFCEVLPEEMKTQHEPKNKRNPATRPLQYKTLSSPIRRAYSEWLKVRGDPPTNAKWSITSNEARMEFNELLDFMENQGISFPRPTTRVKKGYHKSGRSQYSKYYRKGFDQLRRFHTH